EGSFQYRSAYGSEVMSPGSLLLGNLGQRFECGHEHGTGDRCLSFHYAPEFFERASLAGTFSVHRIPAIAALAPWVVEARHEIDCPDRVVLEELAHGLAGAVVGSLRPSRQSSPSPTAADERRISAALRFIEANLDEPLSLGRLAYTAKMSEF